MRSRRKPCKEKRNDVCCEWFLLAWLDLNVLPGDLEVFINFVMLVYLVKIGE